MKIKASATRICGKMADVRDKCGRLHLDADHTEDVEWLTAIYNHIVFGTPLPGPYPFAPKDADSAP